MDSRWYTPIVDAFFRQRDNNVLVPRSLALSAGLVAAVCWNFTGFQFAVLIATLLSWSAVVATLLRSRKEEKERPLRIWKEALEPMETLSEVLLAIDEYNETQQKAGATGWSIPKPIYQKSVEAGNHVRGLFRQLGISQSPSSTHLPRLIGLSRAGDEQSLQEAQKIGQPKRD